MKVIRFDDAWLAIDQLVRERLHEAADRVVVVRDLLGRTRLVFDDRGLTEIPDLRPVESEMDRLLGNFSPGVDSAVVLASSLFAPEEIFSSPDIMWSNPSRRDYKILDRYVIGSDWLRAPFPRSPIPRLTLYGVKGGVGRSTATAVLAWRFSRAGKRVLVLDLDLESPGVGATLLPSDRFPDFGIVDWFVEDNVGQADEKLVREMVSSSPLGSEGVELFVVPAGGRSRDGYHYLPKLARAYAELERDGREELFGDRLCRMVDALEDLIKPDVIFLDSRAGLHDIAAVTVTRMHATSLLFAIDTNQTWLAYRALFQAWHTHFDRAERFREDLKIVAAQVPETDTRAYLEGFRQNAYSLFSEYLYVETPPGEESDFNFDIGDPEAPHNPLRINWSRAFQQFDPVSHKDSVTEEQSRAAYGDFVRGVAFLLFGDSLE